MNMNDISLSNAHLSAPTEGFPSVEQAAMALPWMEISGINALVTAAMPLLLLLIRIKNLEHCDDSLALRNQAMREINQFEEHAKQFGCTPRTILASRYCLCTALDEFALATEWGANGIWAQQSLLSLVHKETWGGERFFIILEKMAEDEKENIDFLELLYMILSLGFEGKYYNQDRMVREEIRHRLFRLIQNRRAAPQETLSPSHDALKISMPEPPHFLITWLIPIATTAILLMSWFGFNYQTGKYADPILTTLQSLDNQAVNKYRKGPLASYLGERESVIDDLKITIPQETTKIRAKRSKKEKTRT
jgi:type VI secretion system protein ImpK